MDSALVIKVKYGDTLRRFTASVNENGLLDLDMTGLKVKILSLFKFAPDADLTLTYIDEDDDVITLVNDDDLRDATRQCLNPLRINVLLNTNRPGRYDRRSIRSSTPLRSPRIQHPLPHINSGVAEVLKFVPEPFYDALLKLSNDLTSKTLSSATVLTELVELMSKLGLSHLGPVSHCQVGAIPSTQTKDSESPLNFKGTEDPEALKTGVGGFSNAKFVQPTSATSKMELDISSVTRSDVASVPSTIASIDLNLDLPGDSSLSESSTVDISSPSDFVYVGTSNDHGKMTQRESDGHLSGNYTASSTAAFPGDPLVHLNLHPSQSSEALAPHYKGATVLNDDSSKQFPSGIGHSPASQIGFTPQDFCPINGQIGADGSDVVPPGGYYPMHPLRRNTNYNNSMGVQIFHKGVQCDGCGVHPITGARYKSKVKEDYDLCSICFSEMGKGAEYIRMDRPVPCFSTRLFKEFYDPFHHPPQFQTPPLQHGLRGCGMKPYRPKLDSRFIQDVNDVDGTIMAPSTPFTMTWRMCNNGTILWPHGTHLVWIGGDQITERVSVEIEIPMDGCPVGRELDIVVDFTAPERPGQYVSYWRMALPSGQRFGDRVWVLIQVDTPLKDSLFGSFHGLNLNFPPESSGANGQIIDVNVEPVDGSLTGSGPSYIATELVKPMVNGQPSKHQMLDFLVNDGLLVGNGVSVPVPPKSVSYPIIDFSEINDLLVGNGVSMPVPPEVPAPVSYPIIDFSEIDDLLIGNGVSSPVLLEVPAPVSYPIIDFSVVPSEPFPVKDVSESSGEVDESNTVEQALLMELKEMGFMQMDLNKEILRLNKYNLEQSVDDLSGVAERDPIVGEHRRWLDISMDIMRIIS
ncbi:hypothetical protein HHK36_015651 [Tetracentron sinense]|uniref:Protein NBR1 homolog n=1 Tax=Tetracentron sinense TaxID=13715 RepID=A0A835DE33_TETSI|nr:hypothetical protein HHK36_015651 [Tetracentron sinense]